ncbi:MAG: NfeD family protein [Alphaproteobacteria bacterium]
MDELIAWMWGDVAFWHWWALGLLLVVAEMLATTMFLLGPGLAAIAVGALLLAWPDLDWRLQLLAFAALSVALSVAVQSWIRRRRGSPAGVESTLNRRGAAYIGRHLRLDEALIGGRGRARVDDSWWQVAAEGDADLPAGAHVVVTGNDGATLTVRAETV